MSGKTFLARQDAYFVHVSFCNKVYQSKNLALVKLSYQRVTKTCRLSWLTNSALVYEPKCGGGGCGISANEYSCAHGAQINFGDLTPYLTYVSYEYWCIYVSPICVYTMYGMQKKATHGINTRHKSKMSSSKKFTCKGTLWQVFICLRPHPLLGSCLGWSNNIVGSESGQIQSVKFLQNMVSNGGQIHGWNPDKSLKSFPPCYSQSPLQFALRILFFKLTQPLTVSTVQLQLL